MRRMAAIAAVVGALALPSTAAAKTYFFAGKLDGVPGSSIRFNAEGNGKKFTSARHFTAWQTPVLCGIDHTPADVLLLTSPSSVLFGGKEFSTTTSDGNASVTFAGKFVNKGKRVRGTIEASNDDTECATDGPLEFTAHR